LTGEEEALTTNDTKYHEGICWQGSDFARFVFFVVNSVAELAGFDSQGTP